MGHLGEDVVLTHFYSVKHISYY